MLRLGIAVCVLAALALGQEFKFTIGSPVASQDFQMNSAAFVFRTEGCAEPAKSQIGAAAEGVVKGARRSVVLKVMAAASKPGLYAVYQTWPAEGDWVVSLKGTCAGANAGAIVAIGGKGFVRESSKFFPRPATDSEIDAALKTLAQGDSK
jgi:hypothetical protein